MEKFIYLIRDTGCIKTLSPLQMQNYLQKWMSWIEKLTVNQSIIFGEPVEQVGMKIQGNDKLVCVAGYSEEDIAITGFFIVTALNWDEAIAIAKDCPVLDMNGGMEVKIIRSINLGK